MRCFDCHKEGTAYAYNIVWEDFEYGFLVACIDDLHTYCFPMWKLNLTFKGDA